LEILQGEALYRALLERYSRNPRGWSFTISPSPDHGFFDAKVGGPDEAWHLKLDTIFKPSPFVLGAKVDDSLPSASPPLPLSFGFRRINPREGPSLLDDSPEGMKRLLAFLSTVHPVAPTGSGDYIQGPFLYSSHGVPSSTTTQEQKRVDRRLSDEMLKLIRNRYPSYF
jgi:hypothetical protein